MKKPIFILFFIIFIAIPNVLFAQDSTNSKKLFNSKIIFIGLPYSMFGYNGKLPSGTSYYNHYPPGYQLTTNDYLGFLNFEKVKNKINFHGEISFNKNLKLKKVAFGLGFTSLNTSISYSDRIINKTVNYLYFPLTLNQKILFLSGKSYKTSKLSIIAGIVYDQPFNYKIKFNVSENKVDSGYFRSFNGIYSDTSLCHTKLFKPGLDLKFGLRYFLATKPLYNVFFETYFQFRITNRESKNSHPFTKIPEADLIYTKNLFIVRFGIEFFSKKTKI